MILSAENRLGLFLPQGIAHGFVTLDSGCEVHYTVSAPYVPEAAGGIRWNDPELAIPCPSGPGGFTISERDRTWPRLEEVNPFPEGLA